MTQTTKKTGSRPGFLYGNALFISLLVIALMCPGAIGMAKDKSVKPEFTLLTDRLVKDGFDRTRMENLYSLSDVSFEVKGVTQYFMHNEAKLNYTQFKRKRSVRGAAKYMKQHAKAFANAEKEFGVGKEVITAIILVETRFGASTGKRSIINTLSTMAALSDPGPKSMLWDKIPSKKRLPLKKFEKKAASKSNWAYKELKAFLTYTHRENMNPAKIKGSYAGAMGIAQFMPSNIITLGVDGNKDGKVDLFDHTDAIFSIARYLKRHGWKPGISREKAFKVVMRYNYSKYYSNTILSISELLK